MDESAAVFEVIAIFDPASYDAQKMVPIISTLKQVLNMNLIIFLNCPENLSELPVKAGIQINILQQYIDIGNININIFCKICNINI